MSHNSFFELIIKKYETREGLMTSLVPAVLSLGTVHNLQLQKYHTRSFSQAKRNIQYGMEGIRSMNLAAFSAYFY